jgi:hypothetical protein
MDGLAVADAIQTYSQDEIQAKTALFAAGIGIAQGFLCDERSKCVNLNLRLLVCF